MRPTDYTLSEQLRITSREIDFRMKLLRFTDEEIGLLKGVKDDVVAEGHEIAEKYYEHLVTFDEAARLIGDAESLARLKNHLRYYIYSMFDGQYDDEYVQSRLRVGIVHKRIGVTPKFYIAAFHDLMEQLRGIVSRHYSGKNCNACRACTNALEKIMFFDLTLVLDTYIQSFVNEIDQNKNAVEEYAADLERQVKERTQQLEQLAQTDSLTGLRNVRSFVEELRREISRSKRRNLMLSLIYIDLDGFKQANDTYGHKHGDEVLIYLSSTLNESLRDEDVAGRYGGDEFCILLPQTSAPEAAAACERLIEKFEEGKPNADVTLSVGIAEYSGDSGLDADSLIKLADKAMYEAKRTEGHFVNVA